MLDEILSILRKFHKTSRCISSRCLIKKSAASPLKSMVKSMMSAAVNANSKSVSSSRLHVYALYKQTSWFNLKKKEKLNQLNYMLTALKKLGCGYNVLTYKVNPTCPFKFHKHLCIHNKRNENIQLHSSQRLLSVMLNPNLV